MALDPADISTVSRLLDAALELAPAEREAWLGALPADQQRHAARLRAMLARHVHLDTAKPLDSMPNLRADEAVAHPGDVVGPYRLLREIGRGGMGSVWLAERADGSFKRQVALKLPRLAWGAGLAERMAREREIGAMLEHPNIARLYDAGVDERGRPYLALEYIDGQAIDAWCEAQNLSVRDRLRLLVQVANAVSYAHGRLVVHRDLKPSNVMVTPDGQAHLLDFGIAKLLHEAVPGEPGLTQEQGRVLTPHYASPEQISGEAITVQSDVYSLGVLLYELLTGALPIAPKRSTLGAVEDAILEGDGPLASSRVEDRVTARALRGELDSIMAMAMKRDPAKRYATVAAFADDLQRHLDGHPVSARPDTWAYRTSRFVKRHKAGVALATVALAAIITAAGVAEHQRREAESERDLASRQRENAESIVMFLGEQLGQAEASDRPTDPGQRLDLAQRRAEQLFHDMPEVLLQLLGRFHSMNASLNRIETADHIVASIEAAAGQSHDPIVQAEALCGPHRDNLGDVEAVARIDRGLALLEAGSGNRVTRYRCLFHRSSHMKAMARFDEALHDLDASQEAVPKLLRRTASLPYRRARVDLLNELGQVHAAEQAQAEVIKQMQAAGRGHSVQMAGDLHWRCVLQWRMGRPREGLLSCEQARSLAERIGNTAFVPVVDVFRARLLQDLDQPLAASQLLEGALVRDGRVVSPFPRGVDFVARLHQLRGDAGAAVAVLERDLQQHGNELQTSRDTINRVELAFQHLERGDGARALDVLAPLDAGLGERTFRWDREWLRARAYNQAGQFAKAETAARAAVAEAARRASPEGRSALHGHAFLALSRALAARGRADEARAAALRAAAELTDSLGPEHGDSRAATILAQH